jgi:HEAT repeat protein
MSLKRAAPTTFLIWLSFISLEIQAQEFPPQLLSQVPHAAEKLLSNDVIDRVSLLDELVLEVRDSCTGEHTFPLGLNRSDYLFVVGKILEKDLTVLDEKRSGKVWHKLASLVSKFELKEAAGPISKYLSDRNWRTQSAALSMLDAVKAKEYDGEVAPLLSAGNEYVRAEALRILVRFGSKKALPALISLLVDPDHLKRYSALMQIVLVDGREAAPHVAKLLRDEHQNNRYWALDTLVKLNAKDQAKDIWFLTSGQTRQIEGYAIGALVYFGDLKAVELARHEIAEATDLNGEIMTYIKELNAKAIVPSLIAILENPPKSTPLWGRTDIVYALRKLEAKEASPVLRSYLYRYPMTDVAAMQVLGDFEDKEAVDDLLSFFFAYLPKPPNAITNDTSKSHEAAVALAKIGDKKTWKVLIDAAENPHYPSRSQVIQYLNKHLDPALWKRLEASRVSGLDFKSIKENAEVFSHESKIPIELEYDPYRHYFRFATPGIIPQLRVTPGQPLKQGLDDIVSAIDSGTLPNRFTYIMDGGKIRILTVEEAIKWWRTNILKSQSSK